MKRLLLSGLWSLALLCRPGTAADAVYQNDGTVLNPQVDAITFINRGFFQASGLLPYETFDTLNFTNKTGVFLNSGTMIGSPGFRFNNFSTTTGLRKAAANFFVDNGAVVQAQDPLAVGLYAPCAIALTDPSYLLVWATNIIVRSGTPTSGGSTTNASLIVGANGWMDLKGVNVDLSRSGLEVLPIWTQPFGSAITVPPTNFTPDIAISDLVWAQAAFNNNNRLNAAGLWDGFIAVAPGIAGPPQGPAQPVAFPGFILFGPEADSYMNFEAVDITLSNFVENVVIFVDVTNGCQVTVTNQDPVAFTVTIASNITRGAVFVGVPGGFNAPQITFSPSPDATNNFNQANVLITVQLTNATTGLLEPAYLYVQDTLASETTVRGISVNLLGCPPGLSSRPANYLVDRIGVIGGFPGSLGYPLPDFYLSSGNQAFFDPINIIIDMVTNPVVAVGDYSGYGMFADNVVSRPPAVTGGTITNQPGRIRIAAESLNLNRTRMRGEGQIMIQTPHLISSTNAIIECESLSFNLGSTNGHLKIQSMVPAGTIPRLRGDVLVWSAVWGGTVQIVFTNNYIFTNFAIISPCDTNGTLIIGYQTNATPLLVTNTLAVGFHAFMVDATFLTTQLPVFVYDLVTHSPNVVVEDNMTLVQSLVIDGQSFTLNSSIIIPGSLPFNPITLLPLPGAPLLNWVSSNAPSLLYFTNNGTLSIANESHFGDDRPNKPYSTYVNAGVLNAASVEFKSIYFENRGNVNALGPLTMRGASGKLENGSSTSGGDTWLFARDLKFNGYQLAANGGVFLNVSNSLSDAGAGSGNTLQAQNGGFHLQVKPPTGDLLGTTLQSSAPAVSSIQIDHTWAAEDRGPTPAGYSNNVAIGSLALTSLSSDPLFYFSGTGAQNGLYADVLDFSSFTSQADISSRIAIDPSLTIYFAAANLGFVPPADTNGITQTPEEFLDGQFGGHLRWVKTYAGPNSSVTVLINGQPTQVNRALATSHIIDSDHDGLPNYIDSPDVFLAAPLTVLLNGNGAVSPNYNGNSLLLDESYSMVAQPADGFVFSGWTGSMTTGSPQLSFLMASNLTFTATFTFVLSPGSYNGLFYEDLPIGIEFQRSGGITVTTTKNGKCSGSVQIGKNKYSFSGQLNSTGAATIMIPKGQLVLQLQVGNEHVTGTIGDGVTWTANIQADRAVFDGKSNIAPFAGKYTLAFPGTGDPTNTNLPAGDGYATMTVDTAGKVKLKGALADGTAITESTTVSEDGQSPIYIPLYSGGGQLLGWLTFGSTGLDDLSGALNWIKQPDVKAKFYQNGFDIETEPAGSIYSTALSPVTGFSNAAVILTGGNLTANLTNRVTIDAKNKVTNLSNNKLTMSVIASQGQLKGSVVNPATGKTIKFNGVILQKRNAGSGFFLGTDQSGTVVIEP